MKDYYYYRTMAATEEKKPNQELTVLGSNQFFTFVAALSADRSTVVVDIVNRLSGRSWTSGPREDIPTDLWLSTGTARFPAKSIFIAFQEYVQGNTDRIIFPNQFSVDCPVALTFGWPYMNEHKKATLWMTAKPDCPSVTPPPNRDEFPMHLVASKKKHSILKDGPLHLEIVPPRKGECILTVQVLDDPKGGSYMWQLLNGPRLILQTGEISSYNGGSNTIFLKTTTSADAGNPISLNITQPYRLESPAHLSEVILELTYIN